MRLLNIEKQLINIDQIAQIGATRDITVATQKQTYIELSSGTILYTDLPVAQLEDMINDLKILRV
jgi:hypothetical protein